MLGIRKLDLYVLKAFIPLFIGAFLISLFVFMLQTTWRWVNELVGKGLTVDILGEFFGEMALTLVPMSLPLAVLLAMLISFGNMGEKYELLAMKAAGVPLVRIMAPLFVFAIGVSGLSFYFQNTISARASLRLKQLALSMKQASPALEIPEGVFYNGIPKTNLYVGKKEAERGMLYDVIIYRTEGGTEQTRIVVADSAKLEMAADKQSLKLQLWSGLQFENLQSGANAMTGQLDVPFDRETFVYKQLIIDFDANFKEMDESNMSATPTAKNLSELAIDIDSMSYKIDSIGRQQWRSALLQAFAHMHRERAGVDSIVAVIDREREAGQMALPPSTYVWTESQIPTTSRDSIAIPSQANAHTTPTKPNAHRITTLPSIAVMSSTIVPQVPLPLDSVVARLDANTYQEALRSMQSDTRMQQQEWEWRKIETESTKSIIRRFQVEQHNKFALSLSCIIFFFVGGALGAIIRKGGLGMPTVVSVLIFIFYYIINTSGMKMARDGKWDMWVGMWTSSLVFILLGTYLTYKANRDSVVFNSELYTTFIRRLLGLRTKRNLFRKEVIITPPDYPAASVEMATLVRMARHYRDSQHLKRPPSYFGTFFAHHKDSVMAELSTRLEAVVVQLSYSRHHDVIALLNTLPVLYAKAHVSPFERKGLNLAAGLLLPLGLVLWVRMWRFRLRLYRELKQIERIGEQLIARITALTD
ncbi:MAG: LptF/LptG family permease [Bacteroidales bacterium]|nr:LptF/LptG family permease [Bacteroidales bacterium]